MTAESPPSTDPSRTVTRRKRAEKLLRETPFDFIQPGGSNRNIALAIPKDFQAPEDRKNWNNALAVFQVLHTKPAFWQWNADRVRRFGGLSDRVVRRGVKRLKEEGWVQHVNVYDANRKILTTFLMVAREQLPESQRKGRFSMLKLPSGWLLRTPDGESMRAPETRTRSKKKDVFVAEEVSENGSDQASGESELTVHHPYGHSSSNVETQTLKRAEPDFFAEEKIDSAETTTDSEEIPSEKGPEVAYQKHLARKLERLGEKKDDSEDDALNYEEFVSNTLLPELALPPLPEESRRRRKLWNLHWIESSLLGAVLLQMSSSPRWDVKCARRIVRRANEGYINLEDLRVILFTFDWKRHKELRRPLAAMTFYGKREDNVNNPGETKIYDAWAQWVRTATFEYREFVRGQVVSQRNRLFPREEDEWAVNHAYVDRALTRQKEICTYRIEPDEDRHFLFGVITPKALGYAMSFKRRSEKTQKMIEDAHDQLVKWFASDYSGILLYRKNYHLIPEALGVELDEIKKAHKEHVDKIYRRLCCHGMGSEGIKSHI